MKTILSVLLLNIILFFQSSCGQEVSQEFEYINSSSFENILNIQLIQENLGICKKDYPIMYVKDLKQFENQTFSIDLNCGKTIEIKPIDFKFDINQRRKEEGILLYKVRKKNHMLTLTFLNLINNGNDIFTINENGKIVSHKQGSF